MIKKEEWLGYCEQLHKIEADQAVPYGETVAANLDKLQKAIRDYEFKVYLVGPFSCGKSTLLNNWLGVNLLPKGIAPETAVATELHFSEEERTVLYPFSKDEDFGEPTTLPGVGIEQMKKVTEMANRGELARVCLYINNPKLKEHSDVCLVDLPGLSSACKAHELAINQFVMEKSLGIFCVPMPAGTVQQDALEFLQDMERYRASFNLLLTKADETTQSDQTGIVKQVSETIKNRLGIPDDEFHVGIVSKNDVSAFAAQLDGLKAQKECIFEDRFRSAILAVCADMLAPLKIALAENFSNEKIEEAIANLQAVESKLVDIFNETAAHIADVVPGAVDRVVEKVKEALSEKADGWIAKMKAGGNCNVDIGAAIKRTIMYHVGNEAHAICDEAARRASREFGKCIEFSISDIEVISAEGVNGKMHDSGEIFKASLEGFAAGAAGYAGAIGVVGAAIGSVVPIIGTGIGFIVGTLIGGFIGAFANGGKLAAENERIRGELMEQLDIEGEKSREPVTQLLNGVIDDFTVKLKAAMEEKVVTLKGQMEKLKAEAEQSREEFSAKKNVRLASVNAIMAVVGKAEEAS